MGENVKQQKLRILAGGIIVSVLMSFFLPFFQIPRAEALTAGEAADQKEELQDQLEQLQKQITEKKTLLAGQKEKSASLQNDISILETKISKSQLEIEARNIAIRSLSGDISDTQEKMQALEEKIATSEQSLGSLIRATDKKDDYTLVEVILGSKSFSDFFTEVEAFSSIKKDLRDTLETIKEAHILTKGKQEELTTQKIKQQGLRQIQMLQKEEIVGNQVEKAGLLQKSKTKESFYEDTIAHTQKEIAQIKTALFRLQGSNTDINFGQALTLAKEVQNYTGVRPAFLLAILTQETRIGQNIGSCNISGQTPGRMWSDIMPGPGDNSSRNDQAAYLRIVKSLGISPESRPLSCPQSIGWGGAMGPAQFIPTTWEAMIPSVRNATGSTPPDPWNPRDAFFAAGIYLRDLGAGAGTYSAEMEAAGRYFAGGAWATTGKYYAQSVENLADSIQTTKIDPIESAQ